MKRLFFKKTAAGIMAIAMLASSMPAVVSDAAGNLISNSTFDSGSTGWGTYKESGGVCSLSAQNGKLALNVESVGRVTYACQMYYDIVPLYKNGVYRLQYEISCTTDRFVEGMIQQNGGTYQAYTWKGLDISQTPTVVDYTFTMEEETDVMAKLVFNCGNQGEELQSHTIYLDNVSLELIDDSKVDYTANRPYEPPIVLNQIGYKPDSKKTAVFRKLNGESSFSVVNASTNQPVFTGDLTGPVTNSSADETNYFGDFSSVTEPGTYYITCGNQDKSYEFTIGDDVYDSLFDDSVRMLYLQRCGTSVQDGAFSHPACHNTKAKVYGTNEYIDVTGGWHDAGDYGRYVVPAAKSIADLLYAYDANPEMFSDSIGIPESGNGIPDVLDEVRYELEWMLKMQASSGGVYHKVTCENFPGYIMPELETGELIVTPVTTTATADFCASMAMAYEFYKDIDQNFAGKCMAAAKKAWDFLQQNPNMIFKNPEDITTGEYGDTSDKDERYWAAAQMYRATGEAQYLSAFESMGTSTGLDWSTVGDYGNIAILTMKNIDKNSSAYSKAKNSIILRAETFANVTSKSPYGAGISKFNWGSNMTVANAGIILGIANQITGEDKYIEKAEDNLNYLLGKNPNAVCFVTGYGTVSPQNPHHRPSMAAGQAMKGMLVGGVNSNLEDSAAKAYLANMPSAKCYVDHSESYSTNEITIYWNSPLTYLMVLTSSNSSQGSDSTIGDVNMDGRLSMADAVLLQRYLAGVSELTQQQKLNADMNSSGNVNIFDLCMLKEQLRYSK
ncbi:MAG: glycoside hydrolase family 9 protein [Ruminococcus sp.]